MKIVGSDGYCTWFHAACPACDLPLIVSQPYRTDCPCAWHLDDEEGTWCDECPRCGGGLPRLAFNEERREPELVELNGILAEQGEPGTCLEELERAGIRLEAA